MIEWDGRDEYLLESVLLTQSAHSPEYRFHPGWAFCRGLMWLVVLWVPGAWAEWRLATHGVLEISGDALVIDRGLPWEIARTVRLRDIAHIEDRKRGGFEALRRTRVFLKNGSFLDLSSLSDRDLALSTLRERCAQLV